ncbi:MAG: hypothetical protein ACRC8S_18420 [Fimbriiglobus sp.]
MYTMVMMMAMSGSADTAGFNGKLLGGSCHGARVVTVAAGCTGAVPAPAPVFAGCTGAAPAAAGCNGCHGSFLGLGLLRGNGCNGNGCNGSGFLGLRSHFQSSGCHGTVISSGCHGTVVAPAPMVVAAPAPCCGAAPAITSTGCVGGVVTISETPAPVTSTPVLTAEPVKEMPKAKEEKKPEDTKKKSSEGI